MWYGIVSKLSYKFQQSRTLSFDHDQFTAKYEDGVSVVRKYSNMSYLVETARYLFLKPADEKNRYVVIPKVDLSQDNVTFLKSKIKEGAILMGDEKRNK
jgi:hypothetical protein